ncbi:MAG: MFS transporter [Clostridia bacterium]|nr:MFS transporter [Clostridia bacterium]
MEKIKTAFKENSQYKIFLYSILAMGLSYGIYKGIIDNYLAEVASMNEFDKGLSEFFREMPGLFLVFILAAFYTFSAEKLYKIGSIIMLAGMGLHSIVPPTRIMLIFAIFIFSLGDHIQLGMKSTLTLQYSKPGNGGTALGYMNSVNQVGHLIGYLVVGAAFLIITRNQPFKLFFWISTALCGIGAVLSLKITGDTETDKSRSRFYFRKKYTKYYMLEVFYGARKQVFFTFGPYVLILFYKANTAVISLLYAISAIACFFMAPIVGRIIDKFGYKIVMIMDTVILVGVCFFYGFAHRIFPQNVAFIVCCANYVLDSVISLASMASSVYVQDISESDDETRATLSTGISVNHMITILIALFGGWIWQTLGMETLFIISAILGLCNSAYAATIKTTEKA